MHIAEYLGALQPHIILNNYEANTHWFPLRWNPDKDPYVHLGEGPGFEGWLPTVNFEKFRMETGKDVDYVITWCLNNELRQYEGVMLMQDRLKQDYIEVLVTEGGTRGAWVNLRCTACLPTQKSLASPSQPILSFQFRLSVPHMRRPRRVSR